MALPKLSEKAYVSVSLVGVIISLSFWVGGLATQVGRHDTDIAQLKVTQEEHRKEHDKEREQSAARLDTMAQDLASIRAKLDILLQLERGTQPRVRRP